MAKIYTKCRDAEGNKIYLGDTLVGSYGIPPRCVVAKVKMLNGRYVVYAKGHNPEWCGLRMAVKCLQATRR